MSILLPYIDTALRQVAHLPHQEYVRIHPAKPVNPADAQFSTEHVLSQREIEILQWVTLGKTNPEIGSILEISAFTVKNHLQRLFKKLEVSNRAQAVGKFKTLMRNV
jgi:DNA-binding CsgD family transcriptional regulator